MSRITTVVFDLGGVLIDWNPLHLYNSVIPDQAERTHFLNEVCTMDWNEEQDAGRSISEGTLQLIGKFPQHENHIRTYYDRWEEMLGGHIEGTVEILKHLKFDAGMKLYALTNWSAETFPIAVKRFEFLNWFDGRLVSGEEKIRKPFPNFYQLLIDRFNIRPEEAVYIDDNARNLGPAAALGFHTIHFQSPEQLKTELGRCGL